MSLFKNKSNKNIRINSRVYIEPGQVMELDDNDRNVQMYVAIKYLSVEKNVPAPVAPVVAKDPTPVPEAAPVIVVEEAPVALVEDVVPVIEEEAAPMVIVNEEPLVVEEAIIDEPAPEIEAPVVVVEEPKFKRNKKKNNE